MKLFTRKSKSSVGLDIGSSLIKVVEVDHSSDQPVMTNYGIIKLPPEAIVEGEMMDQGLVVEGIQECMTKAGISTNSKQGSRMKWRGFRRCKRGTAAI